MAQWETVIGLEIHIRLSTRAKIFSGSSTAYGAAPNTQAGVVDLGLPGALPVVNEAVFRKAVKFGIGINAAIARRSVFDRKNYFYPDLPKGYQISQLYLPIVGAGELRIPTDDGEAEKTIGITRAHLEEDAGKSMHEGLGGLTGVDLNRAGAALLEVVSEPQLRSAKEAAAYMRAMHTLARYLDISDGNMQEGSFRCDANVSVRRKGDAALGTRAEIKNLNSFRFVERAIEHEAARQVDVIESGGKVAQETRLYDSERDETRPMRGKEEAEDYRYFPDPDLLPVILDDDYIEAIRREMPELPWQKRDRFIGDMALSRADADTLTAARETADYFEAALAACGDGDSRPPAATKLCANWVIVELGGALNKAGLKITESPITPARLGGMLRRVADNTISGKIAKQVFEQMWRSADDADAIIAAQGLKQITDAGALSTMVDDILAANATQVAQYKAGQEKMLGYFVGQVMKASQGKANPKQVNEILREKLRPGNGES